MLLKVDIDGPLVREKLCRVYIASPKQWLFGYERIEKASELTDFQKSAALKNYTSETESLVWLIRVRNVANDGWVIGEVCGEKWTKDHTFDDISVQCDLHTQQEVLASLRPGQQCFARGTPSLSRYKEYRGSWEPELYENVHLSLKNGSVEPANEY